MEPQFTLMFGALAGKTSNTLCGLANAYAFQFAFLAFLIWLVSVLLVVPLSVGIFCWSRIFAELMLESLRLADGHQTASV